MKLAEWKGGLGVNKDLPPTELQLGVWSDSNQFRFRNGVDERVGGIAEICTSLAITPYALFTFQTTSARFVIAAGTTKAYAHNGTSWTEITRGTTAVAVSTIVDSSPNTTRELTTSTAHGLTTADVVTVYGCTGTTASDYNAENVAITVTSSTKFTYSGGGSTNPMAVAGSPAYVVISAAVNNFTGAIDDKWTGGSLAGVLIVNNPVNGLFYWNGDTATDLRAFEITTYVADVGRPFKEWFFQLAPTISSTKHPRRVLWSAGAEPGSLPASFVAASTNDAGDKELDDTDGFLIDCYPLGDTMQIYKDDQRVAARWIGGNEVFAFDPIQDASSLMGRNCIANTKDGRQVFLTKNGDVRIHSGGLSESIAEGRIKNYLAGDIDSTNKTRAFLCENPDTNEIWVHYPRSGASTCNGAIFYNYRDNTWGISHRGLNITAGTTGLLPTSIATTRKMIVGTSTPKVGMMESGNTDLGATITATLERAGIHLDREDQYKTLHQSAISGDMTAANTASVSHGYHTHPDTSPTWATAVTYTHNTTDRISAFTNSAKYFAWKMSTTANDWKHRTIRFFGNWDGEY